MTGTLMINVAFSTGLFSYVKAYLHISILFSIIIEFKTTLFSKLETLYGFCANLLEIKSNLYENSSISCASKAEMQLIWK